MELHGLKKEISAGQMAVLDDLIPPQTTLRYADGHLDPIFHETNEQHIRSMLVQALPFMYNHKLDRQLDFNYVNALIKAHDMTELGLARDFTVWEIQKNPALASVKQQYEKNIVEYVKVKYGDWLSNLCSDYMERGTNEAKFVNWLDKYNGAQHILEKQFLKSFSRPDWLVDNIDHIIKAVTADFLIPPTLQAVEERKPLFKKYDLMDAFHSRENALHERKLQINGAERKFSVQAR